jgi:site-specific DNA-methyltransferase (adenine-specific)
MAGFKGKFDSVRQDWETPVELFNEVNEEFHFTLDVAASEQNKKVERFISQDQDAMTVSWGTNTCWLNPPYGKGYRLSEWVGKAYKESLTGATTVMLIPARTNTNWFQDYCLKYGEVRFVRGRPKFGGADHGLPQPLCFVIFKRK